MRTSSLLPAFLVLLFAASGILAAGGGDILFKPPNADPVLFSHDYHLKERGLKCAACHFKRFSRGTGYEMKKDIITKRDFCSHCHNGLKAFDLDSEKNCTRCHIKR